MVGGVFDTGERHAALGTAKNVVELARGKDFFPDRPMPGRQAKNASCLWTMWSRSRR